MKLSKHGKYRVEYRLESGTWTPVEIGLGAERKVRGQFVFLPEAGFNLAYRTYTDVKPDPSDLNVKWIPV